MSRANDERWMRRAIELAARGVGLCSPNPTTGAVVVSNGEISGEGFHTYDGRKHAEILALEAAGPNARGATLYVNLEPCSHTGRTGPCTDAIIAAGVKRVVAAVQDPNPLVSGSGFRRLRSASIEFEVGIGETEARVQHEAFAKWISTRLPFVTLKSAMTLDGQLALPQSGKRASSTWITSEESRAEVHRMRHASDALLTGIGTILADDPRLTDRSELPRRRPLLRVILDSRLRLPLKSQIVRGAKNDLLVFTSASTRSTRAKRLRDAGLEVINASSKTGKIDLHRVLRELGKRDVTSVILEAGSALNGTALAANTVDKLVLFCAPIVAGQCDVPFAKASRSMRNFEIASIRRYGPDFCVEAYPVIPYSKSPRKLR
ncbi:MAG TPA: bifunctional diaminohydroxyphosphoribosylaminopyrimidine deaminase/5-amino-6-(5-phosphoribosylamino)uracil reductase RibD [Candidatus Acidoferrales bacterium]|nr:bifunctional diaminohydroxyphosphoribosylaminopyrimidine deaminase/5-amino-6-(5-phosphoribosylamino)uracil reductase RibD [Candidatus Acidoferrales bacterium]